MRQPDPTSRPESVPVAPSVLSGLAQATRDHSGGVNFWPWIERRMTERIEAGRQKYGVLLETHNGRDALEDAWQEAADLVQYLTQAELEGKGGDSILPDARLLFLRLSRVLWERDLPDGSAYAVVAHTLAKHAQDQQAIADAAIFGTPIPEATKERMRHWGSEPDRWDGWRGGSEPE